MPVLSRMVAGAGHHPHTIAVVGVLAGVVGILLFLFVGSGVVPLPASGVVQATEVKIAPEISGRLALFAVVPGQSVHNGDALVELANPELEAALVLAQAQLAEARTAASHCSSPNRARRSFRASRS